VANVPDIRVRISGEGGAAVVAALDKIANAAQNTGKKAGHGMQPFHDALGSVEKMLGAVGIALGVHQFIEWGKEAAMAGKETELMAQRVGASTEHISALTYAARMADVDMNLLQRGMAMMARNMDLAGNSSNNAGRALARVGLTFKDLKNKDAVEQLVLLGNAFVKIKDSPTKTALAMQMFSRAGFNMVPILNMLGKEGIGKLVERTKELGLLMDEKTTASLAGVAESFKTLNLAAKGVATQFMSGFAEPIADAITRVSEAVEGRGIGAFKEFGQEAGTVVRNIILPIIALAAILVDLGTVVKEVFMWFGEGLAKNAIWLTAFGKVIKDTMSGNLKQAVIDMQVANDALDKIDKARMDRLKQEDEDWKKRSKLIGASVTGMFETPKPLEAPQYGPQFDAEAAAEDARRREMAAKKAAEAELRATLHGLKAEENANKRFYDQGFMGLVAYYQSRIDIAERMRSAELREIAKERRGVNPDATDAAAQYSELNSRVKEAGYQYDDAISAANDMLLDGQRKMIEGNRAVAAKMLENAGQLHAARMMNIEAEITKERERIGAMGPMSESQAAHMQAYTDSLTKQEDFQTKSEIFNNAQAQYDIDRMNIENGMLVSFDAQLKGKAALLALDKQRLPVLIGLAQAQLAAATDPAEILRLTENISKMKALSDQTKIDAVNMGKLGEATKKATEDGLTTALMEATDGAHSLGQAMADAALQMLDGIRQVIAELLSQLMVEQMIKSASYLGFTTGGYVAGPGGPTEDSIIARLSAGEFVVRSAVVGQPGVLSYLKALNAGVMNPSTMLPLRGYAAGGEVLAAAPSAQVGGTITLGLDQGLILKAMESPAGQRVLVKVVGRNPRAIGAALGRG
jgi:hypothetical protein